MRRSPLTWALAFCIALFVPGCAEDTPPAEEAATAPDAGVTAPDADAAARMRMLLPRMRARRPSRRLTACCRITWPPKPC